MADIVVERTIIATKRAVLNGLNDHDRKAVGKPRAKSLALSLRFGNRIVGGIVGNIWANMLQIEHLWVEDELRGKGNGARLMDSIEQQARGIGAQSASVMTMSFHAPDFYRKCGYTECGRLAGFPGGIERYWFRKDLIDNLENHPK